MSNPEAQESTHIEGSILADPSDFLRNFKRLQKGEISDGSFIEWVKQQGQEVLDEEARRKTIALDANTPATIRVSQGSPYETRIRRDREQEEAHLLTVIKGKGERGSAHQDINWVQLKYDADKTLLSISTEVGYRNHFSKDGLEQVADLTTLAVDFQHGISYRFAEHNISAGYLVAPQEPLPGLI